MYIFSFRPAIASIDHSSRTQMMARQLANDVISRKVKKFEKFAKIRANLKCKQRQIIDQEIVYPLP
jgi:predicted transcriptional regulator